MRLFVAFALLLAFPSAAAALPGDPPVVLIAPGNGAQVPANPDGILVRFTCPVFRQFETETFTDYGDWTDYSLAFATKPDLGTDGRLLDSNVVARDIQPIPTNVGPDQCIGEMEGDDIFEPGPQITPGTYYWQASRLCTGCVGDYESSPVWRFSVRVELELGLTVQRRAFARYPFVAFVKARGVPNGSRVRVERRAKGGWRPETSTEVSGERGYVVLMLPRGRQRLRLTATVGTETATSPVRTVRIARARSWTTSGRDDGKYKGQAENKDVGLKVAGGGRKIRDFIANVSTFCVGPTPDTNRFLIGVAPVKRARIAPDGRFYALVRHSEKTTVELYGRVRRGRVKGTVRLTIGTCDGIADFSARLRR
jgi:hypothetical protein